MGVIGPGSVGVDGSADLLASVLAYTRIAPETIAAWSLASRGS